MPTIDNSPAPKEEWLSPSDLARELGIPLQTVYVWRTRRLGPRGHTIGRHVRFSRSAINEWLAKNADDPLDAA